MISAPPPPPTTPAGTDLREPSSSFFPVSHLCPFSSPVSPRSPPPGRIQGRKLIGRSQKREHKTPLRGDAASKQYPKTLGGSKVWSPRNCSPNRGIPRAQAFRFPWGPRSAIRPRHPAPASRGFYNLWFSNHPSPPPFLRTHSFAPRSQRPYLNQRGKQPPALQTAARADERAPRIFPEPGPDPSRGAPPPPTLSGWKGWGSCCFPPPQARSELPLGVSARGLRPQPAPPGSREGSPAAAGPADQLSRRAGRRGRGGAAYRVRRAGRQAAARPTAASWCRGRRRRSLPAGGPAGSRGTARGRESAQGPEGEASRSAAAGAPSKSPSGRCCLQCKPEPKPPRQGTGRGCPGPGRPAPRAAAPAAATAPGPAPRAGPAPSRPRPPPPPPVPGPPPASAS